LRVGWLDMFSRAAITMSACTDFVVERAVDFVGFCTEDGCEVVRHYEVRIEEWRRILKVKKALETLRSILRLRERP